MGAYYLTYPVVSEWNGQHGSLLTLETCWPLGTQRPREREEPDHAAPDSRNRSSRGSPLFFFFFHCCWCNAMADGRGIMDTGFRSPLQPRRKGKKENRFRRSGCHHRQVSENLPTVGSVAGQHTVPVPKKKTMKISDLTADDNDAVL